MVGQSPGWACALGTGLRGKPQLSRLFKSMDADSNGLIELDELTRGLNGLGIQWDPLTMKEIFQVSERQSGLHKGTGEHPLRPTGVVVLSWWVAVLRL